MSAEFEQEIRRNPTSNEEFLLGLLDEARGKPSSTCSHPGCKYDVYPGAESDLVYITERNMITAYNLNEPRDRTMLRFCYYHWVSVVKLFGHALRPAQNLRSIGWNGDEIDHLPESHRHAEYEPKTKNWWIWYRRQQPIMQET